MWSYTSQTEQMLLDFEDYLNDADISESVKNFLNAWIKPLCRGTKAEKSLVAYLIYMIERLVLMKHVLKDTGSIYFHCDSTASHYIKVIMDGIFGYSNFRNEIVWGYNKYLSRRRDSYPRNQDTLLFYAKNKKNMYFNLPYIERETTHSKRGYVPQSNVKEIVIYREDMKNDPRVIKYLDKGYKLKRVVKPGVPCPSTWTDIPIVQKGTREHRGYETQKPLRLLERIIEASCPDNGVVMDPFCGCGTACEAAVHLKRRWIGMDISIYAIKEITARLEDIGIREDIDYELIKDNPAGWNEYEVLNPYEKQDFLIRKVRGFPNPRKSGDGGIDGDIEIHLGTKKDKKGESKDEWGKVVFSVKTGKQKGPRLIRELKGLLNEENIIGCLILEEEPTEDMYREADKAGIFHYCMREDMPPQEYSKIQILTAGDIVINSEEFALPPTLQDIKHYRELRQKKLI